MSKEICFKEKDRICGDSCMAYEETTDGKPLCVLLCAAAAITGALMGIVKAQASSVTYPASPPAPEVR